MIEVSSILYEASFWTLVSFSGFLGVAFRFLKPRLFEMLDTRSAQIRDQLLEAKRIHIEAEELLKGTRKQQERITLQIKEILELAEQEIVYLQEKMEKEERFSLSLMENLLSHKIQHNHQRAEEDIRAFLVSQTFEDIFAALSKKSLHTSSPSLLDRFEKSLDRFSL